MKKKILFFVLVLSLWFIPFVSGADKPDALPVYVNSPISGIDNDLQTRSGERVFWSNHTELFYIFTHFDHDIVQHAATHPIIGYAYSADGVNWVVVDDFFEDISVHAWANKEDFDFAISPDGRYIWFAWHDTTVSDLFIVKCELFSNGTITPLTANQQVVTGAVGAGHLEGQIDIELSSEGYPFVAFDTHNGANTYFAFVRWCNDDSGTWVQAGQDSFDSLMTWNKGDTYPEFSKLLRLEDGKMAWAVDFYSNPFDGIWRLEVGWYNGNNWLATTADQLYVDLAAMGVLGYHRTDTVSFNDIVIGTYTTRITGNQRWIVKSAEYNQPFTNATTIVADYPELTGRRTPNLGVNQDGDLYAVIFLDGSDSVNYTYRFSNYTWGPIGQPNLVKWYDNNSQTFNWDMFTCSERFENYLGFVYHDNSYARTELLFDYLAFDGDYIPVVMQHLNTTLYNQDGSVNDGWIFEGEVYDLVSYVDNATRFFVNTTDSRHDIRFQWNNETEQMWISVDPADQFTIGLPWSNYTRIGDITRLQWRFIPDRSIVDAQNQSWGYFIANDYYNVNATGSLGFDTTIYNLGGFVSYEFNGDAGRITGGDSFEVWAENSAGGAYAYAETVFRKLQGVNLLYSLDVEDGDCFDHHEQTGYVEMGIQFRYNNTWVDGWYYHLTFVNGAVDPAGTPGKAWMVPLVEWNSRGMTGTVLNPRDDLISAYPETGDDVNNDRTKIRFWADLWFNRMNASTVVGGRVNAYYFGMDQGGFMGWAGWAPVILNETSSMYFDDLRLPDGNITDSLEIEMVKFWVKVGKIGSGNPAGGDCDNHRWALRNYEILNWKIAPDRMQGIDTPIFVETKSIEMPSTGFLQPLYKAIDGLGTAIWAGALGFQKILWGAMDSFFAWAGFGEGFFSRITAFLGAIPELFMKMMENIPILIQNMVQLIEDVFGMVTRILPEFVLGITWLTESVMNYWTTLTGFFTGGILPINLIQDLQLGDWLRAGFALLPSYELFSIIWAKDSGKKAKERMDFYSMIFNGAINFIKGAISFMQSFIQTIMDILPG